jgi:uncharacterized protein YukE
MSKGVYGGEVEVVDATTGKVTRVPREYRPDATAPDLRFNFEGALDAARDMHQLADEVAGAARELDGTHAATARRGWEGPLLYQFNLRISQIATDAADVATMLRQLADLLAQQWAQARGQQDRINFARYVDAQVRRDAEDQMNRDKFYQVGMFVPGAPVVAGAAYIWDHYLRERLLGRDDYGAPPENPPAPSGPGFSATRDPQYSQHGP